MKQFLLEAEGVKRWNTHQEVLKAKEVMTAKGGVKRGWENEVLEV